MGRTISPKARHLLIGLAAILFVLTFGVGLVRATASNDAAERTVRELVEGVWHVLGEEAANQGASQALLPLIEAQTDLRLLGRLALGRYWREASPEQRAEYLNLFRSYMLQTFVERLRPYAGTDLGPAGERFRIVASRPVGRRDILVQSQVAPPASPPLQVDWRLRAQDDVPVIIDLIVEGVSLLITQRSEFAAVIERAGIDGLLSELRARVSQPI